jgi:hypothetical protein
MDRRRFLLTSLTGALAAPLAAAAQQTGRVYRIGFLTLAGPLSRVLTKLLESPEKCAVNLRDTRKSS